jgi:hypothetical protein
MNQREIKFRAWDGKHEKMLYDVGFLNGAWHLPNGLKLTTVKNVMQYTGLKDKTGKGIYEGDIVKCFPKNAPLVSYTDKVIFEKGAFKPICLSHKLDFEVIGNIYANPDLIQK